MSAAGADEHLADRDALDVHAEDLRRRPRSASSADAGELDAAGLAAAADEDLGLDRRPCSAPAVEEAARRPRAPRPAVSGDLPAGNRQALGEQERLGVGFLDLHAARAPSGRCDGRRAGRDGTASSVPAPTSREPRPAAAPAASLQSGMAHRVTLIPGDGIGPELAEATTPRPRRDRHRLRMGVRRGRRGGDRRATARRSRSTCSSRSGATRVALKGPITTPVGDGLPERQRRRSARRSACTPTCARRGR